MKRIACIFVFLVMVATAVSAMDYEELARYWAPIIYQDTDIDPVINIVGFKDYITNFNFDNNYDGNDNYDNLLLYPLFPSLYPLTAYVYYDVRETETHYFITYAFFHPYDRHFLSSPLNDQDEERPIVNDALADSHENDLEGVMFCIRKNGTMGLLRSCATVAHGYLHTFYIHPDPTIVVGSDHIDNLLGVNWIHFPTPIDTFLYTDNGTPVVFIEEGGHGVGSIYRALEQDDEGDISFNGVDDFEFHGGDGLVYRLVSPGNSPEVPESGNDRDVRYDLLPISDMWGWQTTPPDGDVPFAADTFNYSSTTGCYLNGLKKYFDANDSDPSANPPWVWGDGNIDISDGDFFLDPAFAFSRIFSRLDDSGLPGFHNYIRNDYLSWGTIFEIIYPSTGDVWSIGDQKLILWNSDISGNTCGIEDMLSIQLSRDGGENWNEIGTEQVLARFYHWTVEGPASSTCQIRLVAQMDCNRDIPVYSETAENFIINLQPKILLAVAQNEYAEKAIRILTNVQEGYGQISSVSIHYSVDGGPIQSLSADNESEGNWLISLGQYPGSTVITWQVVASDEFGSNAIWPRDGSWKTIIVYRPGRIVICKSDYEEYFDIPEPNENFVSLSMGDGDVVGLKADGTIIEWGVPDDYEVPEPNEDFISVSCGRWHSLGLKQNGSIVWWGLCRYGTFDVPEPNDNFVAIAAGKDHNLGLKSDGTIVAWGFNGWNVCEIPEPNSDFIAITSGSAHSMGLKQDGTIVSWGNPDLCEVPGTNTGFVGIAESWEHCLGLKSDESITAWGNNDDGQCDVPEPNDNFIDIGAGVSYVFSGDHRYVSVGLKSDGTMVAWGQNTENQCDVPEPNSDFVAVDTNGRVSCGLMELPKPVTKIAWANVINAFEGIDIEIQASVIEEDEPINMVTLYYNINDGLEQDISMQNDGSSNWTSSFNQLLGGVSVAWKMIATNGDGYKAYWPRDGSWQHFTVIDPGPIVAWGWNEYNQCSIPYPYDDFVAVAGGVGHSLGLRIGGIIECWGYNEDNQCVVPSPNENFIAIAAGGTHSLGLRHDGTIVTWGYNNYGQCDVPLPNDNFVGVSIVDGEHYGASLGLKNDGTIVVWGYNPDGLLDVPWPNNDFVAISGGAAHCTGLKVDGSVVSWGRNSVNQCDIPDQNEDFIFVDAGAGHNLALKADGTIEAWGWNDSSQCYIPDPNDSFITVSGGYDYSIGLKIDGTIVTWGGNGYNQCIVPSPTETFFSISAGWFHSLGIKSGSTTAVAFSGFSASINDGSIVLSWETQADEALRGFRLYRATCGGDFLCITKDLLSPHSRMYEDYGVEPGNKYQYKVEALTLDGRAIPSIELTVECPALPLSLSQNYPNPFNPSTTIKYYLPENCTVSLEIFDVSGKRIVSLVQEFQKVDHYNFNWNGQDQNGNPVSSGTYFYRLKAGKETISKKMVLLR